MFNRVRVQNSQRQSRESCTCRRDGRGRVRGRSKRQAREELGCARFAESLAAVSNIAADVFFCTWRTLTGYPRSGRQAGAYDGSSFGKGVVDRTKDPVSKSHWQLLESGACLVSTFCLRRRHSPHDRFFLSTTGFLEGWGDGVADMMRASAVDREYRTKAAWDK